MKTKSKNTLFIAGNAIKLLMVLCVVIMTTVSGFSKEKDSSNKSNLFYASVNLGITPEYDSDYNIIGMSVYASINGSFNDDFTVSGSIGCVDMNGLQVGGGPRGRYEIIIPAGASSSSVYVEMFVSPDMISSDVAGVKAFIHYRSNTSVSCISSWSPLF